MLNINLKYLSYGLILLLCTFDLTLANEKTRSWRKTKKLARIIYKQDAISFYCRCEIDFSKRSSNFDKGQCGYSPRQIKNASGKFNERAKRIEWEHVFSAWEFGHTRDCWKKGGRKNCKRNDFKYQKMEIDLHNLVPVIGELNADRSNRKFGIIKGEKRKYGNCDFEVDFKSRIVEVAPHIRGNIARIYFYMTQKYNLVLKGYKANQFTSWDKSDPVDEFECRRDLKIAKIQGNRNPFVAIDCNKN